MVKVKICGIRNIEDALKAAEFGADEIGVLVGRVHCSDDFITEKLAKKIVCALHPLCSVVLVTHLRDPREITDLANYIGVNTVQLHGGSTLDEICTIRHSLPNAKLYRAIHVVDKAVLDDVKYYENSIDALLLDSINFEADQVGGTGIVHDWNLSKVIVNTSDRPVILAGGLNPINVRNAIESVRPFGVDVNSGVKNKCGKKDYQKMRNFIQIAKNSRFDL